MVMRRHDRLDRAARRRPRRRSLALVIADEPDSPVRARTQRAARPLPSVAWNALVRHRLLDGLSRSRWRPRCNSSCCSATTPAAQLVNAVGGLLLTLPLAARRRAPLAVAGVFAAAAALNAILGGGLFEGEPPPVASLLAGARHVLLARRARRGPAGTGGRARWRRRAVDGRDRHRAGRPELPVLRRPDRRHALARGRSVRSRSLRMALLEREQRQRERVAVADERARIARELHDVVAHSVGVMVVHAQGARRVLDRDPERARRRWRRSSERARRRWRRCAARSACCAGPTRTRRWRRSPGWTISASWSSRRARAG